MFTDELAGNPAKKRADEAKARRLRAKREKEAKEARKRKELERREREASSATTTITATTTNGAIGVTAPSIGGAATASTSLSSAAVGVNETSTAALAGSTSTETPSTAAAASTTTADQPSSNGTPLTAAQKAMEQRKIRAEARARTANATTIQSFIRSKLTAIRAREEQRAIYDKRMSDLIALAGILKKSAMQQNQQYKGTVNVGDYIPPPATASIMTIQFLFFACPSVLRKKYPEGQITIEHINSLVLEVQDMPRWAKLVRYILCPGVRNENLDLDPILPWMQTNEGKRRLEKILCVCVSSVSKKQTPGKRRSSPNGLKAVDGIFSDYHVAVDSFLRVLLRLGDDNTEGQKCNYSGGSRDLIHQKCQSLLMQYICPPYSGNHATLGSKRHGTTQRLLSGGESDLISALRAVLLYGHDGTSKPIPADAERLRDNCMKKDEKDRANLLMKLIVDFLVGLIGNNGSDPMTTSFLSSRFVGEILTIPLLTWKISPSAYSRCLYVSGTSSSPPPLVTFIHHFINWNADDVSNGHIEQALNMTDIMLTTCPAPPVLCLLANLVQLGKGCNSLNGLDQANFHYKGAAEFFNFIATLINAAPQGTFSSRMSAVEWVSTGSTSSPIVLSDVVIDQASAVLSDAYVRALFRCAINDEEIGTEKVINTKTEKDKKQEQDLDELGSESTASVAAKEAMVDRSKSFWQSSKWAKKLSNLISGSTEKVSSMKPSSSNNKGVGQLMNTSSIARQLANGKGSINRSITNAVLSHEKSFTNENGSANSYKSKHEYSLLFFLALCRAYGTVISRWGGGGKEDPVKRVVSNKDTTKHTRESASQTLEPCVTALLNVLCFSTSMVTSSWAVIQSNPRVVSDLYALIDVKKRAAPIRSSDTLPGYKRLLHSHYGAADGNVGAAVLFVFVSCLIHTLIVTDDVEIHDLDKPLPKHQLRRCILLLKKLLYRACCLDDVHEATKNSGPMESNHFGLALISSSTRAMNDLYNRSSRRRLCVPTLWIEEDLLESDLRRCKTHADYIALLSSPVCRICPFLISFKRRLKLFERIVATNRIDIQGSNELRNLKPGIIVKVMRGRVLEDGLIHLNNLGRNMRQRIVVSYLSEAGTKESGVDVGGLFKEFWTDLSNLAFDPNYALFRITEGSQGAMYPNPSSKLAHGSDHIVLFEFLGRILGKALYEGITIQPQFAHLFLSFLRGDKEYLHLLTDLSTIDPQLYNNLMFLKTYEGDASDLCLTFTVANDDFGVNEVPLISNGANIEVTNTNKRRYIYLVAKHHVCDRIKEQSDAFTRGLWEVIDRSWLRLFNEPELQVLISGASDGKIDIYDMKSNTRYTGGYTMIDRNVVRFWNVVSSFTPKQQADLLRFVTSCERPPPLGFASMNPPFTIQRVGIMRDGEKLPTASTCFNTLKLPTYSSEKVLKDRLLYAIQAGAGFELT